MSQKTSPFLIFTIPSAIVTAGIFALLYWRFNWHWVVSYLVAINFVTWLLYGYDKVSAARDRLRVPEKALYLFTLVGGTIGALAAMRLFRHKTAKKSFRFAFWSLVLVQAALVGWMLWQLTQAER